MKKKEILYFNKGHQEIIERLLIDVKQLMYFATEDEAKGKYQDFLNILESVFLYSNNFHTTTLKAHVDDGVLAEFIFLIPNMIFYTSIGFLTALKTERNKHNMESFLSSIAEFCEDSTSELADVLIDATDEKNMIDEITSNLTIKN